MTHASLNQPDGIARYAHALTTVGAVVWAQASIVDDFPIVALLTSWVHPDPARLLGYAQALYESRAGLEPDTLAAVAVLVRETAPLSRYDGLVREGETRRVKVVQVRRDGSVRSETDSYAPTETDRDGGPR